MSQLSDTIAFMIRVNDLPEPVTEYRFAAAIVGEGKGVKQRLKDAGLQDWRFDFAYLEPHKIAVEVEGGTWNGGRHTRGKGYENDCRKYNAAILHGWRVLRFTSGMVTSGEAVKVIKEALRSCNATNNATANAAAARQQPTSSTAWAMRSRYAQDTSRRT